MKVRLKQPAVEARQWDGDLLRMQEWLRAYAIPQFQAGRDAHDPKRLRVTESRFSFSLAEGDWLIVSDDKMSLQKVKKDDFEDKYERAGLHDPVCGWTPMTQAQHELTVILPGMLLQMGDENWPEFTEWLAQFAVEIKGDPKKIAYSVG